MADTKETDPQPNAQPAQDPQAAQDPQVWQSVIKCILLSCHVSEIRVVILAAVDHYMNKWFTVM